ncbi:ADP,ATP carrier protein 1, chloroplastic-like [Ananas comosus]|uniref:ADP,ATP carrier protein n=1 Tax=Ananas comosus TaxID=4615 RepID=A0A6P5FTI8_ANACO|nr:ADP,ATP carrier protein 1, chloroplastic-like [Ananas comosus]
MEGVILAKGLLSTHLKPNPLGLSPIRRARAPPRTNGVKIGAFPSPMAASQNPLGNSPYFARKARPLWISSLAAPPRAEESPFPCGGEGSSRGAGIKRRNRGIPRADAAVSGDGAGFVESKEKPKFLGVEVMTLKKIIPLGIMFFCILFNYTILRDTKDVLVVTAKGSSAEIIPFLKTWVNLPMAIGFMLLYTKLSNVLSKEALFYTVIFPFIAFFGAFAFVLYPLRDVIHPTALADRLVATLGPSFLGPVAILRIWSFCLFYVMAELWGSVVISVLFWGFANQITTVEEAKEFYPLFGLGANIALIFSGRTVKYFSNLRKNLGPGVDGWAISLKGMMSIVVILGLVISGIYWGVNKFVLSDPSLPKSDRKKKKEKPKLGMKESLKVLLSSRYVRDLATLVVAYGISINLVEVTWKSKLKAQFPSPNEYSSFMGDFSTATGIATFTMMLLGRVILRKFGWGVAAMITPTVLLLTGVGFFSLLLFGEPLTPMLASLGMTPLLAAVYVGALQNIFSKSAKYSLFDPCKEMAYIPLDEDMKVKGKAAIDVVCNPLGKSGGALIQQFMILTFGSLANSTPYLGGILLVIVLAWLGAARSLDTQFSALAKEELVKEKSMKEKAKDSVIDISVENGSVHEKSSNGSVVEPKLAPESESSSSESSAGVQ